MSPPSEDSLLSQRYGSETVNYYGSSPLNRYSFLRCDEKFLSRAVFSPSARFIILKGLNPLVVDGRNLVYFDLKDVRPLLSAGDDVDVDDDDDDGHALAHGHHVFSSAFSLLVFLGLAESEVGNDDAHGDDNHDVDFQTSSHAVVKGRPYFAIDVSSHLPVSDVATAFLERQLANGYSILSNPRSLTLTPKAASIFAQARSIIDWNTRNPFCAGCGCPTVSIQAGYKRVCPKDGCPTHTGVSNLCFPRSDPTMIAAVVSADGNRILLGRQARYPPRWYSCLAGFLEPGESVEDAVRREVWEEAGVKVGRIVIHSTQPWPYPASLMIGAIAQALSGEEDIVLNDKELESASWFTLDEVRQALDQKSEGNDRETGLRVPPPQAIANRLMTAVVQGFLTGIPKI